MRKSKRHAYCYGDSNSYGDANTDAYSYGNSDLNADSSGGEAITDAETASNNTSTASVV